jgi:hypothetical protein
MNPDHNLAVESYVGGVMNLNLYFASWAAFALSWMNFFHCTSHMIETMFLNDDATHNAPTDKDQRCPCLTWAGLTFTSFVMMIASSRIFHELDCNNDDNAFAALGVPINVFNGICDRTSYGVALGAMSALVGIMWLTMSIFFCKGPLGSKLEFGLVFVLLTLWTFGIALFTYNKDKSPASTLGNMYVFTWSSWVFTICMFMTSFQNVMKCNHIDNTTNEGGGGDVKDEMTHSPDIPEQMKVEEEEVVTDV